jgi:cobalt-zinc-cadmium efflux system outer membrane protein
MFALLFAGFASAAPLSLADLENMALANNPTVGEAEAGVRAAAGLRKQAGFYPNPTVGYQGEQIRGGEQRGGEQGFFVSQNIVLGGKLGAARRVADLRHAQSEMAVTMQRQRISGNVRLLFYRALAAQRMVEVRRDLVKLARDAAQTSHQLGNVGQADRPDLLQAEVEAEEADLNVATAIETQKAIWRTLATTVGKPDLAVTQLEGDLEAIPDLTLENSVDAALRGSPAVSLARQEVERAEASVVQEKKTPIPDLQIRGGLEQNFGTPTPGQRPIGLQGFAEVGIQLPLFNRNQGNIEAARSEAGRAKSELLRTQLELRREIEMAFGDYATARATVERYRTAMLPRAREAYELYERNYQKMTAAYQQVLLAQRTYFQLQVSYVGALERAWESAVSIQGFALTDGLAKP